MRMSRIARPGAAYDASGTEQTFTEWQMIDWEDEKDECTKIEERESIPKAIK